YAKLMKWTDQFRILAVRTNADTPEQVTNAVAFGAEGIGLCRTEHMFFEGDRIDAMREMILAGTKDERARALAKLLPYQRADFIGIFTALKGLPATIRFLDPPLHEFFPTITRSKTNSRTSSAWLSNKSPGVCTNCMNLIRCLVIAVAASGSHFLKSPRCRRAQFLKQPRQFKPRESRFIRKL